MASRSTLATQCPLLKILLVIALCFITAALSEDWQPQTAEEKNRYFNLCLMERKYSKEDIHLISMEKIPDSEDGNCFFRCMGLKSGIYNDREGYNATRVAITYMQAGSFVVRSNEFHKCLDDTYQNSESKCTRAGKNLRCLFVNRYIQKKSHDHNH